MKRKSEDPRLARVTKLLWLCRKQNEKSTDRTRSF